MTTSEHLSIGLRATAISLALNIALGVVKLVCGMVGHSYALVADAVESLGDVVSGVIVRAGLVIAARPADSNHPYGHGKAEPLAALTVSIMLLAAATTIAVHAVDEIRMPHRGPAPYTLVVLIVVVFIKESMYRYEARVSRAARSTAVLCDAWHHRSDAITSAAAALGILIALVGGPGYETADDWAALLACCIIMANGLLLARASVHELMDTAPAESLLEVVAEAALAVEGALAVEKVLIRKAGPHYLVDMHLEVDPLLPVRDGHAIAHKVKDAIISRQLGVTDVLIHVEPHELCSRTM